MLQCSIKVRDGTKMVTGHCAYVASIVIKCAGHHGSDEFPIHDNLFAKVHRSIKVLDRPGVS